MKIKEYLEYHGLKQKWLADKIGMSSSHMSQVIRGVVKVPKKYMKKIVEVTDNEVTLEDLLDES